MEVLLATTAVVSIIALAAWWVRQSLMQTGRRGDDQSLALLQSQISSTAQQSAQQGEALRQTLQQAIHALTSQVSQAVTDTNRNVGDRLDHASQVIADVQQRLGQLGESSNRMIEIGRDIASLQAILQPPKLRGALGELFLADLLAQMLPTSRYTLQHRFKGGETVDAVVILNAGLVPIDAKFPLENFKKTVAASTEEERKAPRRLFVRDVKGHIDDIAQKYIRMEEGTFDFALMYIPAENVYYETIVKDDDFGGEMSLFNYALKKRVIPVSPNSFYAYLQTIILGLKGMRIEESAREVMEGLARLYKEFDAFSEAFRLLGQHLDNSAKKYEEASRRFGRIESRIEQMEGMIKGVKEVESAAPPSRPATGDS